MPTIEELRKMLVEVTKNLDRYTNRDLKQIQAIGDKLKEVAMYEVFFKRRSKRR